MDGLRTWLLAVVLTMLAGSAFADAIDGSWCHTDGRRFSIKGPEIVTPGGKRMDGTYSRHAFNYTVPAPEAGAGQGIFMTLADENTVYLRRGEVTVAPETWVRCGPSISARRVWPKA